jgi:L-ascorbate metabolism protein UlaG (beta-lactamase superfamily)
MIKRMILISILIVVVSFLIYTLVTLSIQKGRKPKGERLERIMNSENYQQEVFRNKDETNMDRPPIEGIKQMMKKGVDRNPTAPLKTIAIDTARYNQSDSNETLITWLGHSTMLIKINGLTIITDPVFSKRASMFQFIGPQKFAYSCTYKFSDLPKIDIVLLSHDHYDHLDYGSIRYLKDKADRFIMPLGVGSHLEHWGVNPTKIEEYDWWEKATISGVEFTATPGRHFTGRMISDRFKTLWCGWAIKSEKNNFYFSGDSGYFDGFEKIGEKLGPFDFSFVECGQYSQYWPFIHMMPEESVQAAIDVKSKVAMPIHWGKYKLSIHAWYEPPTRFTAKAKAENLAVVTPQIGQTFTLNDIPNEQWWLIQ